MGLRSSRRARARHKTGFVLSPPPKVAKKETRAPRKPVKKKPAPRKPVAKKKGSKK